ncbi:MAG TPA: sugar phosphate isomerase/epimerase family protein [bacterium]|nr:sugar phosphate isomerase/epimerase family protein [bacterium]HPN35955.1 sugar phosphate isomerase/epimerase family protein [bacterium]
MSLQRPLGLFIVCDEALPARLQAGRQLSIPTAQILAPGRRDRLSAKALARQFEEAGMQITVVFCGFSGESYADIPTVAATVGLVPPATRSQRLIEAKEISDFAAELGVPATALHIGFIGDELDSPEYRAMVATAQELCDHCRKNNQRLHLETGQETAQELLKFIAEVNRPNLAVNFDPANMILYGCGEPLPALKLLGPLVKSVHCKDAKWAAHPGKEWGLEVPLGEGDVDMAAFIQALNEIGYAGPLTIEREIVGDQQLLDMQKGVELLNRLNV